MVRWTARPHLTYQSLYPTPKLDTGLEALVVGLEGELEATINLNDSLHSLMSDLD